MAGKRDTVAPQKFLGNDRGIKEITESRRFGQIFGFSYPVTEAVVLNFYIRDTWSPFRVKSRAKSELKNSHFVYREVSNC